jgi:hypothetical protein
VAIAIIEPDQDVAPGLTLRSRVSKPLRASPVWWSTDEDVDAVVPEGWRKRFICRKAVGNSIALTETVRQSQRVEANIAAQDLLLPRQTKEVRQLAGATPGLEHDGTVRQLLIEGDGEPANLPCLALMTRVSRESMSS